MGCTDDVLDEFQAKKILPTGEDGILFVTPQWGSKDKPLWYVIYRITLAVLLPIWVSMDCVTEYKEFYPQQPGVWFLYATNWTFMLLAVSAVLHAVIVTHHFCKTSDNDTDEMPVLYSVFWSLYNVSANSALIISVSFWTFMSVLVTADYMSSEMSEMKHSLPGVYVIIDLLVAGTPVRFLHCVYPVMFGLVYLVFNAVYFLNGGNGPNGEPYTYYVLYWKKPGEAITTAVLETLLAIMMQLLLVGIYKFRLYIYNKVTDDRSCEYTLCGPCKDVTEEHSLLEKANTRDSVSKYDSTQN